MPLGARVWCLPATHTVCLLQKLRPVSAWNSSVAHGVQLTWLTVLENWPTGQSVHRRSNVAVGAELWYSPAMQVVCLVQEPRPISAWNSSVAHGVQLAELLVLLNVPGAHFAQERSSVALGTLVTYSPTMQTVCLLQKPRPSSGWNASASHTLHATTLVVLLYVPSSHWVHVRSVVAFGATTCRHPATQTVHCLQKLLPASG